MSVPDRLDPDRWVLAPGCGLARRPPAELQVGTGARALVVADEPGPRRLLHELADLGAVRRRGEHDLLWRRLLERDLVVRAADLHADLAVPGPGAPGADAARGAVTAAYAAHGGAARAVLARRRAVLVGLAGRPGWTDALARLLGAAGVGTTGDAPVPGHAAAGRRRATPAPDLWVLADLPDATGALVRHDLPHLTVGPAGAGGARVGPFTVPGAAACLRCLAAARADRDPGSPLVDLQLARAAAQERTGRDDAPRPEDPALVALAVAWAAADVVAWVDGRRPSTWSATVDLDGTLPPTVRPRPVHPRCGCGWAA